MTLVAARLSERRILLLIVVQVALGIVFANDRSLATYHAIGVFALGLYFALFKRDHWPTICVAAYLVGGEVLWRMTKTQTPWEFGKYSVAFLLGLRAIRVRSQRASSLPITYFLLLVPSVVMSFETVPSGILRENISFNLSGPFAIALCIFFFQRIELDRRALAAALWWMILPVVSILTIASTRTFQTNIEFTDNSNAAASGGFGPNQVSSMLGLAALSCLLVLVLDRERTKRFRLALSALMLAFLGQAVLTFSRGGPANFAIGLLGGVGFFISDRRMRRRVMTAVAVLFLGFNFVLIPRMMGSTEGALSERYSNTTGTGRYELAMGDLDLFLDNPLFGVGPGGSQFQRAMTFAYARAAPHTEYTRLLAEHGLLGGIALFFLCMLAWRSIYTKPRGGPRGAAGALTAWAFGFFIHAAIRLAAPAFALGLAAARFAPDAERPNGSV